MKPPCNFQLEPEINNLPLQELFYGRGDPNRLAVNVRDT